MINRHLSYRTSNPALNSNTFKNPVKNSSLHLDNTMTIRGTVDKTALALCMLVISGYYSFSQENLTLMAVGGVIGFFLFITLIFSIVRYFIFSLQFILLLDIFGVDVSFFDAVFAVMLVFFFITITPTITIAEIGVRGSVAIFIIGFFSSNSLGILSSTCTLWLINLIIPAIIGSFFIFSLKFFRTS